MKYTLKKRMRLKKNKKQRKTRRGGGPNQSLALTIMLSLLGVANSKYYMTACAGNTCRSPVAETMIKRMISDPTTVTSFGVNVRAKGSKMADLSEQMSLDLCHDDLECRTSVKDHKSQSFNPTLVHNILKDPIATIQIIPMDDKTSDAVKDLLKMYDFSEGELKRITVGITCDATTNVCENKSANVPDPFFAKGTHFETGAYGNMSTVLSDFLENKLLQQSPARQMRWQQKGKTLKPNLKIRNSGR